MGLLEHDEILILHVAAASARLLESRSALLTGIDPGIVFRLPRALTPSDQLLEDLGALNAAAPLDDGTVPLALWLANAARLAEPKKEAQTFQAALARCRAVIAGSAPSPRIAGAPVSLPRPSTQPVPAYADDETRVLCVRLDAARERRSALQQAGFDTAEADAEILRLRRQLRDGGQLQAGDSLGDGRYLLLRQIGRGGFAGVWDAQDRRTGARVAAKVLHNNLVGDPVRRDRFFRGARRMAELHHEAVVRVLEPWGEDGGYQYFIMELAHGGDLERAVLEGRVKREAIVPMALRIGDALCAAHDRGMVHRDVKPANILLDSGGSALLTDFDLVGHLETTGGTRTGALGSFVYSAPEVMDRPQDADARADIYSLAMTTVFGLHGSRLPVTVLRDPTGFLKSLPVEEPIKEVLQRALSWEVSARFGDVASFCAALREASSPREATTRQAPPAPAPRSPAPPEGPAEDDALQALLHNKGVDGLRQLGGYRIVRRLGRGGMGSVYEAIQIDTGERVALKVLHRQAPEMVLRLKREFRAAADLVHPNLVALYELAMEGPVVFIVMEYIDGRDFISHVRRHVKGDKPSLPSRPTLTLITRDSLEDLETLITVDAVELPSGEISPQQRGTAPPVRAGRIFHEVRLRNALRQLAAGLNALHDSGVVHRDIKPSNVLVTRGGRVVVLDFGLVFDLMAPGGDPYSRSGTPAYMSPEQVVNDQVGAPADWYCFGAMLYEALTGRLPFEDANLLGTLWARLRSTPPEPSGLVDGVPGDLESLCMALLQRDPEKRPGGPEVMARLDGPQGRRSMASTPSQKTPQRPLVGREEPLARLSAAFESGSGGPAQVHVHGPEGIGKTALVTRFLEGLSRADRVAVLASQCHEREKVPYRMLDGIVDALTMYLRRASAQVRDSFLQEDVHDLAALFPVLYSMKDVEPRPAPERPVDPREIERRAGHGLRAILRRMGEALRVVIFVDDLQWADRDSALLMAGLLSAPDAPALLFITAHRSEQEGQGALFHEILRHRGVARPGREVHEVWLEPLSHGEATELALTLLERDDEEAHRTASQVAEESKGIPARLMRLAR